MPARSAPARGHGPGRSATPRGRDSEVQKRPYSEDASDFGPLARSHRHTTGLRAAKKMDLIGVLSNHDLQGWLARLVKKLAAVRASGERRRQAATCRQRPRRPGWVLKAVVWVLADRGEPMRAKDIHAAVEAFLGVPVAGSSVKAALAANVSGSSRRFVRIARGRYTLA
jgi:hypothetical protein